MKFNTIILNRSKKEKEPTLTINGEIVYNLAKDIVKKISETEIAIKESSGLIQGKLRIGASLTIGEYCLPEFLGRALNLYILGTKVLHLAHASLHAVFQEEA